MRNRKVLLGKIGAVLVPLAGVAGVFWPDNKDQFVQLAIALAGVLTVIAGSIAYEDGQQANAAAQIEVAKIQKGEGK